MKRPLSATLLCIGLSAVIATMPVIPGQAKTKSKAKQKTEQTVVQSITQECNSKYIVKTPSITPYYNNGGSTWITKDNFDYDWYLEQHPDLKAAVGTDRDAIYNFYLNTGAPNGWPGKLDASVFPTYYFDSERYAEENPDVVAAVGNSPDALLTHYINNGAKEGRKAYSTDQYALAVCKANDVLGTIIHDGMSDRDKVLAVNDWMVDHITYDYSFQEYHFTGPLLKGTGVCEAYAETFDLFMTLLGIQDQIVDGMACNDDGWGSHAWNRTKIDGAWLYTDVTWNDATLYGNGWTDAEVKAIRHKYYLSTDPNFSLGDHQIGTEFLSSGN
ncbi:MAG: transglutaminase domain-containing protein [Lachnospiraceae bacterium]